MNDILPIIIAMIITAALIVAVTIFTYEVKYMYLKAKYDAEHEIMKRTGYHPLICNDCKYRRDLQEDPNDYPKSET